jgi:hypothetical protein
MADQAEFKWGGRFSGMDRAVKKPVSGRVFGSFSGQFPADQQQLLAAKILMGFQNMLAGIRTPLGEAIGDLPNLSARLTETVQADLQQTGATGTLTIAQVQLA